MPSATAGESGYNAVSALMQLSTALAPNHNMPSQSVAASTEQSAAIAALRQLTSAGHSQPAQPNRQVHVQPHQQLNHQAYMQSVPNQQAYMHALLTHQAHLQSLQANGHGSYANGNQGYVGAKHASHQNGNESDDSEKEAEKRHVQENKIKQNPSSRMGGRSSNFRPRIQPVRREAGKISELLNEFCVVHFGIVIFVQALNFSKCKGDKWRRRLNVRPE